MQTLDKFVTETNLPTEQLIGLGSNGASVMVGKNQAILVGPQLKMKEVLDTRWLSHDRAVTAIRVCLPALASLEREASERSDDTAAGLAMFVKKYNFVATIKMMSDILPHLSRLSKTFQIYRSGVFHENHIPAFPHVMFPNNPILEAMTILDPDLLNADDATFNEWIQHMNLKTLMEQFKYVGTEQQVMEEWETLRTLLIKESKELTFRQTLKKSCKYGFFVPMPI